MSATTTAPEPTAFGFDDANACAFVSAAAAATVEEDELADGSAEPPEDDDEEAAAATAVRLAMRAAAAEATFDGVKYSFDSITSKRRNRNCVVSAPKNTSNCSAMHCRSSAAGLSFFSRAST